MFVGVIYGEQSKIVRRIIVPDDPGALGVHIGNGEAIFRFDFDEAPKSHGDVHAIEMMFYQEMGVNPPSATCAVVNLETLQVVDVIKADPIIDGVDGADLVRSDDALVNDKIEDGVLLKRHAITNGSVVSGFIWESDLPAELDGMAFRDSSSNIGDTLIVGEDVPVEGVEDI